jgi:hypothetical protein
MISMLHHMARPPQKDMASNMAAMANPTHHPSRVTPTLPQPHQLVILMVAPHNLHTDPAHMVHHRHMAHSQHTGLAPMARRQ